MAYASRIDLEDRFGAVELAQLTDRENGAIIDMAVLNQALADADAEINGYLAVRYLTPVVDAPPLLVRIACDITRYRLYDERTTEAVRQRYEDCRRMLKDLSSGAVQLIGAQSSAPAVMSTEAKIISRAPARQFGPDELADF